MSEFANFQPADDSRNPSVEQGENFDALNELPQDKSQYSYEEGGPLQGHEDWLEKVKDLEARAGQYRRAIIAEGGDPDTDPDLQRFMGQVDLARDQLIGYVTLGGIEKIEEGLQ